MANKKMAYFLDKVPVEIRDAVMELDNDNTWAIFIALTLEGEKYFTELKNQLDVNPNTADIALKKLVTGGLVAKKAKKISDMANRNRTYYAPTRLGTKLFNSINDAILPPLCNKERISEEAYKVEFGKKDLKYVMKDQKIVKDTIVRFRTSERSWMENKITITDGNYQMMVKA